MQGDRGSVKGLCPTKLFPTPQENVPAIWSAPGSVAAAGGAIISFTFISFRAASFLRVWCSGTLTPIHYAPHLIKFYRYAILLRLAYIWNQKCYSLSSVCITHHQHHLSHEHEWRSCTQFGPKNIKLGLARTGQTVVFPVVSSKFHVRAGVCLLGPVIHQCGVKVSLVWVSATFSFSFATPFSLRLWPLLPRMLLLVCTYGLEITGSQKGQFGLRAS